MKDCRSGVIEGLTAGIGARWTRRAPILCYEMIRPRWKTLGYSQAVLVFVALAYYNILISYAGVYIMASCQDPLPWATDLALNATTNASAIDANATVESAALRFWQQNVLNSYESVDGKGFGHVLFKDQMPVSAGMRNGRCTRDDRIAGQADDIPNRHLCAFSGRNNMRIIR